MQGVKFIYLFNAVTTQRDMTLRHVTPVAENDAKKKDIHLFRLFVQSVCVCVLEGEYC